VTLWGGTSEYLECAGETCPKFIVGDLLQSLFSCNKAVVHDAEDNVERKQDENARGTDFKARISANHIHDKEDLKAGSTRALRLWARCT